MGKQIHFIQQEIDLYYTAISFPQISAGLAVKDHPCCPFQSWCRNHAGAWDWTRTPSRTLSIKRESRAAKFYPSWIQLAELDRLLKFTPYSVTQNKRTTKEKGERWIWELACAGGAGYPRELNQPSCLGSGTLQPSIWPDPAEEGRASLRERGSPFSEGCNRDVTWAKPSALLAQRARSPARD